MDRGVSDATQALSPPARKRLNDFISPLRIAPTGSSACPFVFNNSMPKSSCRRQAGERGRHSAAVPSTISRNHRERESDERIDLICSDRVRMRTRVYQRTETSRSVANTIISRDIYVWLASRAARKARSQTNRLQFTSSHTENRISSGND